MVQWCCVCKREFKNEENIQYHRFLKSQKDAWLEKLGLTGDPRNWRVCSEHFKPEDYQPAVVSAKPRLKANAVPSLNLNPQEIDKSSSKDDDINGEGKNVDLIPKNYHKILEAQEEQQQMDVKNGPTVNVNNFIKAGETRFNNLAMINQKNKSAQEINDEFYLSCIKTEKLDSENQFDSSISNQRNENDFLDAKLENTSINNFESDFVAEIQKNIIKVEEIDSERIENVNTVKLKNETEILEEDPILEISDEFCFSCIKTEKLDSENQFDASKQRDENDFLDVKSNLVNSFESDFVAEIQQDIVQESNSGKIENVNTAKFKHENGIIKEEVLQEISDEFYLNCIKTEKLDSENDEEEEKFDSGKLENVNTTKLKYEIEIVEEELILKEHHSDDELESKILRPTFDCTYCKYTSKRKGDLHRHMLIHQSNAPTFKCELCDYQSKLKMNIRHHIVIHQTDRPLFVCAHCEFKFKRKQDLRRHIIQVHQVHQTFNCVQCDYKSKRNSHLRLHMLRHQVVPLTFNCIQCSFKSKKEHRLKLHMLMHQSNCPTFDCSECSYKTKRKYLLTSHMVTHQSDAPTFECEHCNYKSKVKMNFLKHVVIHQPEVTYDCDQCSYKTKSKHLLRGHMLKHHSESFAFTCVHCNYKTKRKFDLARHMKLKHPEKT